MKYRFSNWYRFNNISWFEWFIFLFIVYYSIFFPFFHGVFSGIVTFVFFPFIIEVLLHICAFKREQNVHFLRPTRTIFIAYYHRFASLFCQSSIRNFIVIFGINISGSGGDYRTCLCAYAFDGRVGEYQ